MAQSKNPSLVPRRRFRPATDSGNAALFAKLHGDEIRYVRNWNKWMVWGGHRWRLDHNNVYVTGLAKDVSRQLLREANALNSDEARQARARWAKSSGNRGKISAMVELARDLDDIAIEHDQLDQDPYLLGVENGVIDLRTGKLRDGDSSDLMMMASPVALDPEAKARRWHQAMEEWFPDDETRDYLQRLAGAALIGEQYDHILVIHFGDGGNGKGTFVRAIAHVLGEYFVTPHMSLLVEQTHSQHGTEKAKLFRTRLAVAAETEHRQRLNEAEVKNLTGGDAITARRMREDPWEFIPSHSLWLQTNYMPEIRGRDTGIWRRIRVVPWDVEFGGKKKDRDLDAKLRKEAPGILNWLIDGALAYQRIGLDEPSAVLKSTLDYRASEDTLGRFAEDFGLVFDEDLYITMGDLIDALEQWCDAEGIRSVPSAKEIAPWLGSEGATKRRKRLETRPNPVTIWEGVGFSDSD